MRASVCLVLLTLFAFAPQQVLAQSADKKTADTDSKKTPSKKKGHKKKADDSGSEGGRPKAK